MPAQAVEDARVTIVKKFNQIIRYPYAARYGAVDTNPGYIRPVEKVSSHRFGLAED